MAEPMDYSQLSDDELFSQLPAAPAASRLAAPARAVGASGGPAEQFPGSASDRVAAEPAQDFSSMSDDELFSSLAAHSQQPVKPERSTLGEIGHQIGLTGRAMVNSVAALPAMAADAVAAPINAGLALYDEMRAPTVSELVTGKQQGYRFPKQAQALNNVMDAAGVAQPENATERVVQDIATGMGAAASGVGAGRVLAQAAGPLTRTAGRALAASPGTQVLSGATGAGAAGLTRENDGGAVAQTVAGLAGALAPSVLPFAAQAGMRGALRGGEAGRQRVVDNMQTFDDAAGAVPTIGQATQSRALQGVETGLTNVVGGSGIMIRKGEQQAKMLQDSVQRLTDSLAPNASGVNAGEAIARGVGTFKANVKETQERLYGALDKHIAPDTPITVSRTRAALEDLNSGIDGAPNLSAWFRNAKINGIEKSLVADLEQAASAQAPAGGRSGIMNAAAPNLDAAALPYESIKKLRTLVGRELADNNFASDVPRSKWSALYGALSEDLGTAAKGAGPAAEQAWQRANTYTRLANDRMEQISSIVNKDAPEHIFRAATTGLAEGGTQIRRLMKSMPVENRREVAAAVLQRLGRAKSSSQNEMNNAFSSETFLSNLSNISEPARRALFGMSGFPGLQDKVQLMAKMAAVRRDGSTVFSNPSGTARQSVLLGWSAALGGALLSGNPALIAKALAVPAGAAGLAKIATSPSAVQFLGDKTVLNRAAGPAAFAAVARSTNSEDEAARNRARFRAAQERYRLRKTGA